MLQIQFKFDCRIIRTLDYFVVTYTEVFINLFLFIDISLFAAENDIYIFLSAGIFFK